MPGNATSERHAVHRHCPICRRPVSEKRGAHVPFCEACRVRDLGKWAAERDIISEPALEELAPSGAASGSSCESADDGSHHTP